jgi:hypothetical protein
VLPVYVRFEGRADVCALTTLIDYQFHLVARAKQGDLNSVCVVGTRGAASYTLQNIGSRGPLTRREGGWQDESDEDEIHAEGPVRAVLLSAVCTSVLRHG